jgi:hypothetical protein
MLRLNLGKIQDRLHGLTDALVDGLIDKTIFQNRKAALLEEKAALEEKRAFLEDQGDQVPARTLHFLELAGSAYLSYERGIFEEKRDLVKIVTSNREIQEKKVEFTLKTPFDLVAARLKNQKGSPCPDTPRTWERLLKELFRCLRSDPVPGNMTGKTEV